MSSVWNSRKLTLTLFGESHGEAVGMVLDGFPAGEMVDFDALGAHMARRAPGRDPAATARKESDTPRFLSGLLEGVTTGAPICAIIENSDRRSGDYQDFRAQPRPGHADYAAGVKYGGCNDLRGGGHFSARLTAPLTLAGGLCLQALERRGVAVGAHLAAVAGLTDVCFDPVNPCHGLEGLRGRSFPVLDPSREELFREAIEAARREGDSVGGVVECAVAGLPCGLGAPIFTSVESRLSALLFSVPAVKGVEFGAGFDAAALWGSGNNDAYCLKDGQVRTVTNRSGGITGGITTGMPVIFRAAFKPTPSISRPQQTLNLKTGRVETLEIRGRHDPCVALRAVPVVESAAALAAFDLLLEGV